MRSFDPNKGSQSHTFARREVITTFGLGAMATLASCGGGDKANPRNPPAGGISVNTEITTATTLPTIWPASDWNRTSGSGFRQVPIDPERTRAKPAIRPIFVERVVVDDSLIIGVAAMAEHDHSLLDNFGLQKVIVHFEGNTVDIDAPSLRTFEDVNGNPVTYLGWWVRLRRPQEHSGNFDEAQVYFEAVPKSASKQRRVIGPYTFFLSDRAHDHDLQVAPTAVEIVGKRYRSFSRALEFLNAQGRITNPRITFIESGVYSMDGIFWTRNVAGWTTVEASVPITFAKTDYRGDSASSFRPKFGNFRFRGANISIDFVNSVTFYTEADHRIWMDGVKITNSGGVSRLIRGGPPNMAALVRATIGKEKSYFTECRIEHNHNVCNGAQLVRGCHIVHASNDLFSDVGCSIKNYIDTLNNDHLAVDVPALSVQYLGAGATAKLSLSGFSDQASRTLTAAVDDLVVGTYTVHNSESAWMNGDNYAVSNVVAWLNSLPDWTATEIDNSRRATGLSVSGNRGAAFTALDVKHAAATLVTHFDLHSDVININVGGVGENVIHADNTGINLRAQCIFLSPSSPAVRDYFVVNNSFIGANDNPTGEWDPVFAASQLGRSSHSHVVVAHNSLANQRLVIRTDQPGFQTDPYCLIANNVFSALQWGGNVNETLAVVSNHLHSGAAIPSGSIETTIGGNELTLFRNAPHGDFAPSSELLRYQASPCVRSDALGYQRGSIAAKGSLA